MDTPWGVADVMEPVGDSGIVFVSTPSHGGYYVPPELNSSIPEEWRKASFNGAAMAGWYEEDCDAAMVPLSFPALFARSDRVRAARTAEGMQKFGFGWASRVSDRISEAGVTA